MLLGWDLGALAALSACAPYPGYDSGYGYSYGAPAVVDGYYGGGYGGGGYYGGGYAAPYFAPVPVESTIILGGDRDRYRNRYRGGSREYYGHDRDRGRPNYARPQAQAREPLRPAAVARPAPPPPRTDFGRPGGGGGGRGGFNPANPTAQGGADR